MVADSELPLSIAPDAKLLIFASGVTGPKKNRAERMTAFGSRDSQPERPVWAIAAIYNDGERLAIARGTGGILVSGFGKVRHTRSL